MPKFVEFQEPKKEEAQSLLQDALGRNGAEFARNAAMFMPGKPGMVASAVLGALDNAHGDRRMAADLAGGALKGLANYELTNRLMGRSEQVLLNSVTLGVSSRFINEALDYRTYTADKGSGLTVDPEKAFAKFGSVFSTRALTSDLALGTAGAFGLGAVSHMGLEHLRGSKLASSVMTGSLFGFISGGTSEVLKEHEQNTFNIKNVGAEALRSGFIAGSAASIGGLGRAFARGTHINEAAMAQDKLHYPRLGRPELVKQEYVAPKPDFKINHETKWTDFYENGTRKAVEDVHIYRPTGQAPLMVQAEYGLKLDQIRSLRERAMGNLGADTLGVLSARLKLDLSPYKQAALPETLLPHMDSVPDRSMFRDIHLQERYGLQSYFDLKRGEATSPSAEVQTATNTMWVYKPQLQQNIGRDIRHEWSHIAKNTDSRAGSAFDHAAVLERDGWNKRSYAELNSEENWAVNMGELMLEPAAPVSHFEYLTIMAPVRSAVMGKALGERLSAVAPENRSDYHDLFISRVEHIRSKVQPGVEAKLEKNLNSPDETVRRHAAEILGYLRS